jgi:hypothetical protein
MVAGVDVATLLKDPDQTRFIRDLKEKDQNDITYSDVIQQITGLELEDLEHLAWSLYLPPGQEPAAGLQTMQMTMVIKTKRPYSQDKVLSGKHIGPRASLEGKEYFRLSPDVEFSSLYLPTDRILVLTSFPQSRLPEIFALDGKRCVLSNDVKTLLNKIGKSQVWTVTTLKPPADGPRPGSLIPPQIRMARGFGIWFKGHKKDVTVHVGLLCQNDADALQLTNLVRESKDRMEMFATQLKPPHDAMARELVKSLTVENDADLVVASAKCQLNAVTVLEELARRTHNLMMKETNPFPPREDNPPGVSP